MANVGIPQPPQNQPAESPLMGLYLDRPPHMVDPKGFSACNNVRIEFGQVRSDLLGWESSAFANLGQACLYLSRFVNSAGLQRTIAVGPQDIFLLASTGTISYLTPCYNIGTVSISNNTTTLSGTGTWWAQDIQSGVTYTAASNATTGANTIVLNGPLQNDPNLLPISDTTSGGAILEGTYVAGSSFNIGANTLTVTLTQALNAPVTAGDSIFVGSGINLRPNVRSGDYISFGNYLDNSLTSTWYLVTSVNSNNSITLGTAYTGSTLVNSAYRVRQVLTDTLANPGAFIPPCTGVDFPNGEGPCLNGVYGGVSSGDDFWFFTNGVDPVVTYPWNAYAPYYSRMIPVNAVKAMTQTRGLLVLGGLTSSTVGALPTSIANSDNGFPEKFAGGVSFQGVASDGPFTVSRLGVLGSTLMIYCTGTWGGATNQQDDQSGSVVSGSFVGFPTIWAFSDIVKTRGPVCGGAVVEFPDRHQFLTTDGELRYNGLFIQVMNDQVWRAVMKNFDPTRAYSCYAYVQPTNGDLIWGIPLLTDPSGQLYPSTAYVEHYMEQANSYLFKPMTQRDFPFTTVGAFQAVTPATFGSLGTITLGQMTRSWGSYGFGGSNAQYLAGDFNGNIWSLYVNNTQNGVPALCTATWGARQIGNGRSRSLLTRVYPELDYMASPAGTVSITVQMQDAPVGPITITDTKQFDITYSGNRFTSHFRRGREVTVTISDSLGIGWACAGYDIDWVPGGMR